MKRVNVKQTILFSAFGVIPVVWLALVTAPAVSGVGSIAGKLPGVLQSLTAALNNPLKIRFCEGSLKTALFFIAAYGMGIGIYLSTRRNTRPREEHGSARWGDAAAVNRKIADELLKPEYNSLWNALLYGVGAVGDGTMIGVAETQIGNIGGEIYWRWYGFDERVEWCAIFVSWVANQCGFTDAGIVPLFSSCAIGIEWFKDRDLWQEPGYTPAPGDYIFFDWGPDGVCDHVGIVESVTDGKVNTIEGNSGNSVRRKSYDLGSVNIFGYGIPAYN